MRGILLKLRWRRWDHPKVFRAGSITGVWLEGYVEYVMGGHAGMGRNILSLVGLSVYQIWALSYCALMLG